MAVLSRKNQLTVPVEVMREAGLAPGDTLHVVAVPPGRIELVRTAELIEEFAGEVGNDVYPPGYLEALRSEWE
ncbi:MAG TPA: AbrB/MazE/SpoVT family DNA-binding domain-containing protein [Gaiellaceae bacterium]|nr:AbrB/MazE/SpoVT family DNA-binding domain-containing protein [Gaiellaceae bacterium]